MNALPRSLFGRHALLIAVLLLLTQAMSVALLHRLVYLPRVAHGASVVARQLAAWQQGLQALPPHQREAFIAEHQRALAAAPAPDPADPATSAVWAPSATAAAPALALLDRGYVQALVQALAARGIQARWQPAQAEGLWLRLVLDGRAHWLLLPQVVPGRSFTGALVVMLLGSSLAALGAALWLQRRLNRPLGALVRAARSLAAEQRPAALPEDGPVEIATVSRSFNRLVGSLALAERERSLMLAGISHDLRTPLTKLRLGVEILRGSAAEPAVLASMARSITQMDDTIGQFLDFARDEAAPTAATPQALERLVREAAQACADHQRPVLLQLAPLPPLPLQPQAMRRVLDNLLENAWRHGRPPVVLRTSCHADEVWLEVRDHGPGLPPGDRARLRRPFVRGESARGGVPGAGLGLAISERTVKQHGGHLQLLDAEGGGLLARVALPLPGSQPGTSPAPERRPTPAGAPPGGPAP